MKNEDLRKYAPESYNPAHMEDSELDGSFLDMKQRNVVEILDMKVRKLKKKNDMIMNENENLRTELKLLCAADQDVHNDFTNSKLNVLTPLAEIARLQRKIKKLKDLNGGLELQINSLQAENRHRGSGRKSLRIFDDEDEPDNLEV